MNIEDLRRRKIPIISLLLVLMVVPLVLVLGFSSDSQDDTGLAVGTPAPNIEGIALDNQPLSLNNLKNQWVVVNFFATWCTPCIAEHGELSDFRDESPYPTEVISIIFNQPESKAREFFTTYGGSWPVLAGDTTEFVLAYRLISVPETYLITPGGIVAAHWKGPITADNLHDRIESIIRSAQG